MAGHEVRLEESLLVVAPLFVPDVLVFYDGRDDRIFSGVVPEEAMGLDRRLDPVDHAQKADHRHAASLVVIGTVQVESTVRRPERLPITFFL